MRKGSKKHRLTFDIPGIYDNGGQLDYYNNMLEKEQARNSKITGNVVGGIAGITTAALGAPQFAGQAFGAGKQAGSMLGGLFAEGGKLSFGPLKEQNPYLVPEYNQPKANGYVLPDVNRPKLDGYNASEYKQSYDTGTPNEIQIPSIVGGQYLGNNALERYKITGDKFKPMADPSSYSKYYDEVNKLGLMKQHAEGGKLTYYNAGGTHEQNANG